MATSGEDDGVELMLEPDAHPATKPFTLALVADGIPFASFVVEDVRREYERLRPPDPPEGCHFLRF